MKASVLIAEDEVFIAENLAQIVRGSGNVVVDIIQDLESLKSHLKNKSFDLALLDIRMNGVDLGIEMGRILHEEGIPFSFITSFSDKNTLQQAIDCRPFGYILKPFKKEEIEEQLSRIIDSLKPRIIELKVGSKMHMIPLDDIIYLQSENVYVNIFMSSGNLVVRVKLDDILSKLGSDRFVRTHQSFAVNLSKIDEYSAKVQLTNGVRVPISRKYKDGFIKSFSKAKR